MNKLQNAVATSVFLSNNTADSSSAVDIKLWLPQPLPPSQTFYVLTNVTNTSTSPFVGLLNGIPLESFFSQTIPSFLQQYVALDSGLTSVIIFKQVQGTAYKYSTTIPNDLIFEYITTPAAGTNADFLIVSAIGEVSLGASGISAPVN